MNKNCGLTPFEFYSTFTRKVFGAMDKWFEQLSAGIGLTATELKVLSFLNSGPSDDTAQWAAEQLGISKALVSKTVESLCRKGYLAQQQDTADRRRYHLIVQSKAKPLMDRVNGEFVKSWDIIGRGISEEELRIYLDVMVRFVNNISQGLGLDVPVIGGIAE